MQKILLAAHGHLASGLLSTLRIIVGDVSNIEVIDGYTEAENIKSSIEKVLDSINKNDQLIVFTDLFGGSVNQLVTKLAMERKLSVIIVSGFNVALVLAVVLAKKPVSRAKMEQFIEEGRRDMKLVDTPKVLHDETNEDEFFDN